jgi:hypothetical protein
MNARKSGREGRDPSMGRKMKEGLRFSITSLGEKMSESSLVSCLQWAALRYAIPLLRLAG